MCQHKQCDLKEGDVCKAERRFKDEFVKENKHGNFMKFLAISSYIATIFLALQQVPFERIPLPSPQLVQIIGIIASYIFTLCVRIFISLYLRKVDKKSTKNKLLYLIFAIDFVVMAAFLGIDLVVGKFSFSFGDYIQHLFLWCVLWFCLFFLARISQNHIIVYMLFGINALFICVCLPFAINENFVYPYIGIIFNPTVEILACLFALCSIVIRCISKNAMFELILSSNKFSNSFNEK